MEQALERTNGLEWALERTNGLKCLGPTLMASCAMFMTTGNYGVVYMVAEDSGVVTILADGFGSVAILNIGSDVAAMLRIGTSCPGATIRLRLKIINEPQKSRVLSPSISHEGKG